MSTMIIPWALLISAVFPSDAEEFEPLCDDTHVGSMVWDCWNPVEVAGHQLCHFHGALSGYHHAPPIVWSGGCRDGKAEG